MFLEIHQGEQSYHLGRGRDSGFFKPGSRIFKNQENESWNYFLFYPLKEFQEITWIDSPELNAEEVLGAISEEYLPGTKCSYFVKSLYGQALESTSFIDFFRGKTKKT